MNAQHYGIFASFRSLRADKLGAVVLERCRDERAAERRQAAAAPATPARTEKAAR